MPASPRRRPNEKSPSQGRALVCLAESEGGEARARVCSFGVDAYSDAYSSATVSGQSPSSSRPLNSSRVHARYQGTSLPLIGL